MLTEFQRAVLAHVVVDPDAWAEHAQRVIGVDAIEQKVERHKASYLAASAAPGYKTRAEIESAIGR